MISIGIQKAILDANSRKEFIVLGKNKSNGSEGRSLSRRATGSDVSVERPLWLQYGRQQGEEKMSCGRSTHIRGGVTSTSPGEVET